MEKTARIFSGRSQLTVVTPSPRLVRSRSGSSCAAAITTPERSSRRFSSSERFMNGHRSKSTSKLRTHNNNEENVNPTSITLTSISSMPMKFQEKKSRNGFGKFLQRGVSPDSKRATSVMKLPSAWALSPGRPSLGSPIGSESPAKANVGGGVTNKVLKYFKQRKVSSMQEEEYHRFKILHNRLLQWRFINARTEVAMATVKNVAEADIESIYEAFNTAIKVMDNMEPLIRKYQTQVEKILYQVTELTTTSKQEGEYLLELLGIVPTTATLLENEKSIRVHLIQTKMKSNTGNHPSSIDQSCI